MSEKIKPPARAIWILSLGYIVSGLFIGWMFLGAYLRGSFASGDSRITEADKPLYFYVIVIAGGVLAVQLVRTGLQTLIKNRR